ncbi:purine-nucleoside phosphorylase [Cognataquiflexum rubidum]|uniref:purine-nucleoside phosphorylase n=1 Tax=Cognataquiflexum rubidum TaxID=2922273 RepID=UPI001F12E256|nr:purine-nucleoside phosphorylase [Cognataquiflexum rubidum]MCH6232545.1 purine-nucleoside phosphorylase [Cognataquiflexum rubidum]
MLTKEQAAVDFLKSQITEYPETAIILGSGLGGLVGEIQVEKRISYSKIPHFPVATVEGHGGDLIFGKLEGVAVLAMNGRFHYYEGYEMDDVVFPLRVMKLIGIKKLIVTNAAGGLNEDFEAGDLMLIEDMISLFPDNPLRGKNREVFGPRFPDMSEPFDLSWLDKTKSEALKLGIKLKTGTYIGLQGPKLETKAEIRYCRIIGGDAVGMSTVPEVIAANHMGIKVLGISVITNESIPKVAKEFTHAEVVSVANQAGKKLVELVKAVL